MDNDTYISPQTAIEKHFADGYICGDPNRTEQTADINIMGVVAAATAPVIIPEDKLLELASAIKQIEEKTADRTTRELHRCNRRIPVKMPYLIHQQIQKEETRR